MKRIGIITYWTGIDNYGQTLQLYALQCCLRNKGYDAYVIRYISKQNKGVKWWLNIPFKLIRLIYLFLFNKKRFSIYMKFKKQKRIIENVNNLHPRNFELFKEKYISFSKEIYNQYNIYKSPPEADIYISGSDQIWGGLDPIYYLQFVDNDKKCIAYAPSFGGVKLSKFEKRKLRKYLQRYSVLAMREHNGVELCKSVGRDDAFLVMDPTLLLSSMDYLSISVPVKQTTDYILLYLLGNDMDFDISSVYEWANKHNLIVKYVASQGRLDSYEKIYPNVDEWLGLIQGAKYVVTNSFHGTVFSVIMNRKFLTIPLCGAFTRMNGRVIDLLSRLGLENRIYSRNMDVLSLSIEYDKINDILLEERVKMSSYFDMWFSSDY